jgi:alcohol dehydrogenase (cytochrome c)
MKSDAYVRLRTASTTILGGALAAAIALPASAADVTPARLENADAEPHNWLMGFQNYSSHRFSRLAQINRDNVRDLKVAFTVPLTTALDGRPNVQLENYALVDEGILYFDDAAGVIYKVDGRSGAKGAIVWKADASLSKDEQPRSRGITMLGNAVFHNLTDGRVISVDRDTGEFLLDLQVARIEHPKGSNLNYQREGFTAAPIAVEDMILVGNSKGDSGTNGWLAALDAETGDERWRSYTIPGPGEPGHETWADGHNAWKTGGAALWTTGSYDVEQRLTIWGTAQPVPMFDPEFRPGDNLFSNSAVAWHIDTGEMAWYFQYVPNESWDYDEQGVHMLIDAEVGGEMRQMVTHWGRNGYYYQLDRTNGDFINATQFVDRITWTAGIDPKTGKPVEYDPNLMIQTYIPETRWLRGEEIGAAHQACPDVRGGVRWQPPAYNPIKQVAYSAGIDGCFTVPVEAVIALGPEGGIDDEGPGGRYGAAFSNLKSYDLHGLIAAVDVQTNTVIARFRQPYENLSGVLATAGGLLFTGNLDGSITAHDDETLAEVWRFDTGISFKAPAFTYAVGDKQFVGIMAGAPAPAGMFNVHPELEVMNSGAMLYVFSL